jgi:hypothetical protein
MNTGPVESPLSVDLGQSEHIVVFPSECATDCYERLRWTLRTVPRTKSAATTRTARPTAA